MKSEKSNDISTSKLVLPIDGRDHIQGSINAPIALVEYGDYECPYCGEAYPLIKKIQKHLGDQLCFAFRNFPLTEMHPYAEHAAEAAEAAGAQGKFWEMHDMIYENQEALDNESLIGYASVLGLDLKRFAHEVQTSAHLTRVREDFRSGARHDVNGTPSLFINGVRYDGPRDFDTLLAALTEK